MSSVGSKASRAGKTVRFFSFDIKDLHPTIHKELLWQSLSFAETKLWIAADYKKTIHHSRKSLRFYTENMWMKREMDLFDVIMQAYHGADICDFVGTFLLGKVSEICNKREIILYKDDGLSNCRNKSAIQLEKRKTKMQRLYKEYYLVIIAESNQKIKHYLEVTWTENMALLGLTINLMTKYSTYIQNPITNHTIKHVTVSIENGLSNLSSNEKFIHKSMTHSEANYLQFRYNKKLTYKLTNTNHQNIVTTRDKSYGWTDHSAKVFPQKLEIFLTLLHIHLLKNHIYNSIFNRNKINISYSCMQNIRSVSHQQSPGEW